MFVFYYIAESQHVMHYCMQRVRRQRYEKNTKKIPTGHNQKKNSIFAVPEGKVFYPAKL